MKRWKQLTPEDRDYAVIYLAGAVWCGVFLFVPPSAVLLVFDRVVGSLWSGAGLVGAVMALAGLFARDHLLLERFGVRLLLIAPLVYSLMQAVTAFTELNGTGMSQRWHLIFLGLFVAAWLRKRLRKFGALVRDAKETPLPGEAE